MKKFVVAVMFGCVACFATVGCGGGGAEQIQEEVENDPTDQSNMSDEDYEAALKADMEKNKGN